VIKVYTSREIIELDSWALKPKITHTAVQLDERTRRTTECLKQAVAQLVLCNNIDIYVELGAASSHNLSFIKREIESYGVHVVSTKFHGTAEITILAAFGDRYTLRLIPHTRFNRDKYRGSNNTIILDHNLYFV